MKVKYVGVKGTSRSYGGCSACGKRRTVVNDSLQYSKRMMLPSGQVKVFLLGRIYTVSDSDGEFLVNYTYEYRGGKEHPFRELVD